MMILEKTFKQPFQELSLLISTLNQVKPSTISTAKLNPLLDVHMPPIKQVVYLRSYFLLAEEWEI